MFARCFLIMCFLAASASAAPIVYNAPSNVTLSSGVADILPIVSSGGACTSGSNKNAGISADGKVIYTCVSNAWKGLEGVYWKDPVANFTALSAITSDPLGAVRVTTDTGRMFSWTGSTWQAVSINQLGDLSVPGKISAGSRISTGEYLHISGIAAEGAACSPNGLVGRTTDGLVLSCQSGVWDKLSIRTPKSLVVNLVYTAATDGFLLAMPRSDASCAASYISLYAGTPLTLRSIAKSFTSSGSYATGFTPVRAGELFQVQTFYGCDPVAIYFWPLY